MKLLCWQAAEIIFFIADPTEVYTWGNNINFTLGHGGQQSKHHPELVDLFPRNSIYIKQVFQKYYVGILLSEPRGVCRGKQLSKMSSTFESIQRNKMLGLIFILFITLFLPNYFSASSLHWSGKQLRAARKCLTWPAVLCFCCSTSPYPPMGINGSLCLVGRMFFDRYWWFALDRWLVDD